MKYSPLPSFILLLILSLSMACEENPADKTPESIDFHFEDQSNLPLFISINSQVDGSLIDYFKPDSQAFHQVRIPEAMRAESYMINYYYDARYTYLDKLVKVYSFSDIRQRSISHLPQEQYTHDYKALVISSDQPIEVFLNGAGGNFYNKISDDSLSAYLELGVSTNAGSGRIIVAKLVGETAYRSYTFTNPLQVKRDTLDISEFTLVSDLHAVALENSLKNARLTVYSKFKDQSLLGRVYDSYRQGFSTGFPLVTGDFEYFSLVNYTGNDNSNGLYMTKGIPAEIKPLDLNMEVTNKVFSTFAQEIQGSEIAINTFHDDDFIWHHFDGIYDGFKLVRAEVPQEILDEFPSLIRDSELFATTLLRNGPGATISYDELVLPGNRHYWSHYEVSVIAPLYNKDKEIALMEMKTIRQ